MFYWVAHIRLRTMVRMANGHVCLLVSPDIVGSEAGL